MTPSDASWARDLRSKGLTTAQIARLLAVKPADVRNGRRAALKPSTFINGRGWV